MDLLKNEVYDKLRAMLMQGAFEPGKTYSLNKLAEELQVSRTPVRDAVIRLSNENQLDILPSRGFRLHQMTSEEIEIRSHFANAAEGYCVLCLARACREGKTRPELERLATLVERMDTPALERMSFGEFYAIDNAFHETLLRCLGGELSVLERLLAFTARMERSELDALSFREFYELDNGFHDALLHGVGEGFYETMRTQNLGFVDHPELHMGLPVDRRRVLSFHRRILDAILAGNGDAGYQALLEHADYMVSIQMEKE